MDVFFVGRKAPDWVPDLHGDDAADDAGLQNLKADFIRFIDEQLLRTLGNNALGADQRLTAVTLRAVLLDPSFTFGDTRDVPFSTQFHALRSRIDLLSKYWDGLGTIPDDATPPDPSRRGRQGRPTADLNAQRTVPSWYGEQCMLTGDERPHGAHIVPVRITSLEGATANVWQLLSAFWPQSAVQEAELLVQGREKTNILPMCPNAHAKWDRFEFAIRPVPDMRDPRRRIYLQVLWLDHIDKPGGLVSGCDGTATGADSRPRLADLRRCQNGFCPVIQHGDVFAVVSSDPDRFPLPSLAFLEIQCGVHKLMAGMRAAASLRSIFGDEPPDDGGPVPFDVHVPPMWQGLLDAALDKGVLDAAAAKLWAREFMWQEARRRQNRRLPLRNLAHTEDEAETGDAE